NGVVAGSSPAGPTNSFKTYESRSSAHRLRPCALFTSRPQCTLWLIGLCIGISCGQGSMTIINFKNRSTAGFDEDALFTFAGGEQVLNFGRLTTTGDLAEGIFAAADGVTIRNFGRVETNGRGAVGILVLG